MPSPTPTFPVNGVPVSIYIGDGDGADAVREQVTQDGAQATVVFKCPWNERYAVVAGLLGGVTSKNGVLSRTPPATYPPSPNLFCTSITDIHGIKPMRDDTNAQGLPGWLTYEWAVITAVFSRPTWQAIENQEGQAPQSSDPSGIVYATTRFKVSTEVFSPPIGAYYWQGGNHQNQAVEGATVTEMRPRVEISITRHMMPFVPLTAAQALIGGLNNAPWFMADYGFPRGSVLFTGFNSEPKADPATQVTTWDLEMTFLANSRLDWNKFLDPDGSYQFINTAQDGSGTFPFPYVDFSVILSDNFGG
jgi:hypothetical protein